MNVGGNHWTLVVVNIPAKVIKYYNSCGHIGKRYMDGIYQYLNDEHLRLYNESLVRNEWKNIDMLCNIPQQGNGESNTINMNIFIKILLFSHKCAIVLNIIIRI